jgi:hypothetical protein
MFGNLRTKKKKKRKKGKNKAPKSQKLRKFGFLTEAKKNTTTNLRDEK